MNISNIITLKDFFNYYVAGFLWMLEGGIILMPVKSYQESMGYLEKVQSISDKLGGVALGLIFIVIPFVIGFVVTPINSFATQILRYLFGDPRKWVTDYSSNVKDKYKGRRLALTKVQLISSKVKRLFGEHESIKVDDVKRWFFQIRAVVINHEGEAGKQAIRAQDLANFAESILIPLPLLFFTIGSKYLMHSPWVGWTFLGIGAVFITNISYRYTSLRFYWVKHIYNAFLAIPEEKLQRTPEVKRKARKKSSRK
jgi:hypothetical protein